MNKQQIDWIRSKLEKAEKNGFTKNSKEQILALSKEAVVSCPNKNTI